MNKTCKILCSFSFLTYMLLLQACTNPEVFEEDIAEGAKPWRHIRFDHAEDKFTFAMFSDLTGGERERVFEVAVEQLNLLRPEFILNVGDLVEGGTGDTTEWYHQWDCFDTRAGKARAPIFYVGGNHDLTGQLAREVWKKRNGPRYYHFRYKDVLFLVLDTEDNTPERMEEITRIRAEAVEVYRTEGPEAFSRTDYARLPERTAGTIGEEQAAYFTGAIADNRDVRWTFVLLHKPAWEKENEPHFAAIESALADMPYTVFYGHTHVYKYEQRHGRDYINLATTGGEQFPDRGKSADHLMLITVYSENVTIANLLMQGILDKTGHIPAGGDTLIFEKK